MTHEDSSPRNSWGAPAAAPTDWPGRPDRQGDRAAGTRRRPGRGVKILIAVVAVIIILLIAAEFGLRAVLKNQVADELRSSSSEQGVELSGDPAVSFGASPLLLGLVQQKIPELTVDLPSSLDISYEDSDRSKPVVTGQPAATLSAKDMEISGDNPLVGDLTLDTTLPQEYLLAVLQKSMSESQDDPTAEADPGTDLLSGLIQITGVTANSGTGNLDIEISGGLATLSMTPSVADGALSFDVADLKIFGLSLPDEMVTGLSDSLTRSVEKTENLDITAAEVTGDGLKVRLHGSDVRVDDIASEVDATTDTSINA